MRFHVEDQYAEILQREFASRAKRNRSYSLRAFARDCGIAVSTVSDVMNHKKGLSKRLASKIADNLDFNDSEKDLFCDLVESKNSKSPVKRNLAEARLLKYAEKSEFYQLSNDSFEVIHKWYHFAILSLMTCKNFNPDPEWIASSLGILEDEASNALKRLERLGMIAKVNGTYNVTHENTYTAPQPRREAISQFHYDIISKSLMAVRSQEALERELSSTIIAVDKERLPEAKKLIREFAVQFHKNFATDENADEVYALGMQLFRLSETERGEEAMHWKKQRLRKGHLK